MVVNIGQINSMLFKSNNSCANDKASLRERKFDVKELGPVSPNFSISVPQKYSKLGITTMSNGIQVHSYKLANGHKVTIIPMKDSPAVVKNYVNVGSLNETSNIKGISHFLEHMAFNGTNGTIGYEKLDVGDSFKKIDEIGGWTNASTNYAVTDYVNSSPLLNDTDLEKQIRVIAAMTEDLKLSDEMIEKEKGPVCSEINMIMDDPYTIAMDQTVRTLYNIKNPADELVGGSVAHIKNLTRKDVKDYYDKYYTPDNMNLVITGDVNPDEVMQIVSKNFHSTKTSKGKKFEEKLSPIEQTVRKDFVSDKATATSIILGFAGPRNNDVKEQIAFEIAKRYLWSYSSDLDRNLTAYNAYPYIGSDKISTNPNANQFVYMGVSTSEKNTEKVLRGIYDAILDLKPIKEERLKEIKEGLIISRENALQFSMSVNQIVGTSVLDNNLEYFTNYNDIINEISVEDVNNALKQYFNLNKTAITVVHPKKTKEISFQGKNRQPINTDLISEYKLPNNYNVGLYETNSNNIEYNLSLMVEKPYNKKAGVSEVLNKIYSMGYKNVKEDEFNEFCEKNNVDIHVSSDQNIIYYTGFANYNNRDLILKHAKEMIYHPAITQENLDKAKERIKDSILRHQESAYDLYLNYAAQNSPYEYTNEEILKNIDSITLDDVKDCHKYLLENSAGVVTANIPSKYKSELKNEVLASALGLQSVKTINKALFKRYNPEEKPVVLTKANQNSQADIIQMYKFEYPENLKDRVSLRLMNSILSSSSIGLFDTLREKEHLAYSVGSSLDNYGNCGELLLNILTTTDNKTIEEYSYDNVQKSIKGFHRQINALKNGEFTDKDLANAKLIMKANLLENEGVSDKLTNIQAGLMSRYGITYLNKIYNEIDNITKEDIINSANKVFSNHPIYAIVGSQDTLDYNEEFFANLENSSAS